MERCEKRSVTCKYSETDFLDSFGTSVDRWQVRQRETTETASEIRMKKG